jgi:GNAT superfamily N-acetyltransferase
MADIVYKLISSTDDPMLDQVKPLFHEMYKGMQSQGLMLQLSSDGADKWFSGALNTLGRFGIFAVAIQKGNLNGFAHGALKFLPDYLGGYKTGIVTHIFVSPIYRNLHIGQKLLNLLEDWFIEKKVHSIEIQVIQGNDARDFWEKSGYGLELFQYRKFTGEKP